MSLNETPISSSLNQILSPNAAALESSLQQSLTNYKEFLREFEQLSTKCESFKIEIQTQKAKCDSKSCTSSEALKQVIQLKDTIIQAVASAVTKLNETKNFVIVNEIFKILCGETTILTPPKDKQDNTNSRLKTEKPCTPIKQAVVKNKLLSPKKEFLTSLEDVSFKDDSVSEIEGTPGRTSPIIQSKKFRSSSSVSSPARSATSSSYDLGDKKKCPENWSTPEAKQMRLIFPISSRKSGTGRLKQARITWTKPDQMTVVDLTSSPEFLGGVRSQSDVQLLIKKESSENDDTILPSPTSSASSFIQSKTKESQSKFKKPLSLTRSKLEDIKMEESDSPILQFVGSKSKDITNNTNVEESINILKPKRSMRSPKKRSPVKHEHQDSTHCEDTNASMSLLQHVNQLDIEKENLNKQHCYSPTKRPLAENMNCTNMTHCEMESSISLLQGEQANHIATVVDSAKRRTPEKVEPVYKEPTVRKKAEKMALPAWCCDECKVFMGTLYTDDPEKVSKVVARCSKHRGRNNPIRPKTPPGFWYPRWSVPEDTEEFNRRNDAK